MRCTRVSLLPVGFIRVLLPVVLMLTSPAMTSAQGPPGVPGAAPPLADLDVLTAMTWIAEEPTFSTTLTYRWLLKGRVLEASNDVRGRDGRVLRRYRGAYAWDAGRQELAFWTAADSGELHRGRAWWKDGVLWHEAEVSGGSIERYASAVRPADQRLEYFAAYGASRAEPNLLESKPIVYTGARVPTLDTGSEGTPQAITPGGGLAPPWFRDEIDELTLNGGRWVTGDPAIRPDTEPYGAYGLTWTRGVSGITARGRLYGIDDRQREHDLWELYLFWDPAQGRAIVMQMQRDGTFATGELVRKGSSQSETVQKFRRPDGTEFQLRHVETRIPGGKRAEAFLQSDGRWQPQQTREWRRLASPGGDRSRDDARP